MANKLLVKKQRDESVAEMHYFADTNGTAVRAGLREEMDGIISATSCGKLLTKEVASCLVSCFITQLYGLTQFTHV